MGYIFVRLMLLSSQSAADAARAPLHAPQHHAAVASEDWPRSHSAAVHRLAPAGGGDGPSPAGEGDVPAAEDGRTFWERGMARAFEKLDAREGEAGAEAAPDDDATAAAVAQRRLEDPERPPAALRRAARPARAAEGAAAPVGAE